jgi:hypothetical protein
VILFLKMYELILGKKEPEAGEGPFSMPEYGINESLILNQNRCPVVYTTCVRDIATRIANRFQTDSLLNSGLAKEEIIGYEGPLPRPHPGTSAVPLLLD